MTDKKIHGRMLFILIVVTALFTGCKTYEVTASWKDREITVDGHDDDWRNATMHNDQVNCAIGVINDNKNLYISLTPWGRMTQGQMLMSGLTVWFDRTGKEKKTLGITFPLPEENQEGLRPMLSQRNEAGERVEAFAETQQELWLIYADKDEPMALSLQEAQEQGILVAVGDSGGRIMYELKVPLSSGAENGFAIASKAGDTLKIGFETGKLPLPEDHEESYYEKYIRQGERSTGFISNRYRRSNRSYMPMSGTRMPEPFMLWAQVTLAEKK